MCGIVGVVGAARATDVVYRGLERLEYRGYDSAGIAWLDPAGVRVRRAVGRVRGVTDVPRGAETVAVGHTRWATHGGASEANAHPHLDGTGRFAVVHNGTIEDHLALRRSMERGGAVLLSETDTELLAHRYEAARRTDGPVGAVRATFDGLSGSWTFLALDEDASGIAFSCNRTPLIIGLGDDATYFASDATALMEHTRRVVYLDDGDHGFAGPDGLRLFGADGEEKAVVATLVEGDHQESELSGFEHFMLKEIHETPQAINRCIAGRTSLEPLSVDVGVSDALLDGVRRVRIVACGTSYHAGLAGLQFIERWAGVPVECSVASELRERAELDEEGTLYLGISQSGETLDTLEALRHKRRHGHRVLALTNVEGSSIQRVANETINIRVGPETSVAATKTFLGQVTVLALLAVQWGLRNGNLDAATARPLVQEVRRMPRLLEDVLGGEEHLAAIGRRLSEADNLFFLGRGIHVSTALEAALKFKEVTYLHAEGFGAPELKHGPFALLSERTPTVFFLAGQREKVMGSVMEVAARRAPVFVVSMGEEPELGGLADGVAAVPGTEPLLATMTFALAGQLIAYHAARHLARDIDRPRNLAKSVTVE